MKSIRQPTDDSATGLDETPAAVRSKEELAAEFRSLIHDGEELLKSTTNLSAEALAQAREQFRGKLSMAKDRLGEVSLRAGDRGRRAALAADGYVHENPWTTIGIAVGIAFVLGAMLTRRAE